jgi:hypothetical protein
MTDPTASITELDTKFSDGISSRPFHCRFFSCSMMSTSTGSTSERGALRKRGQVTCLVAGLAARRA